MPAAYRIGLSPETARGQSGNHKENARRIVATPRSHPPNRYMVDMTSNPSQGRDD